MADTPTLKTDEKLDALALAVAQEHLNWQNAAEDKEIARKAAFPDGTIGAADVFVISAKRLVHIQGQYQSSLERLFVAAKELNPDLFPHQGETSYVKGIEAEKTLKAMLNEHIAEIATRNGLEAPKYNEYYQTKKLAAVAAG